MKPNLSSRTLLAFLPAFVLVNSTVPPEDFSYLKNKSVDLRPKINQMGMTVRDQAPRGTCTIFATTFLIEYLTGRDKGLKNVDFSEEYLAAAARRASTDKSDNYFFSEAAAGYEEYGIVDEKDAPYQKVNPINTGYLQDNSPATLALLEKGKKNRMLESEILLGPNTAQSKSGLSDEQFKRILTELDKQNPVAVGYAGVSSLTFVQAGLPFSIIADGFGEAQYAHTVPLVGYILNATVPGGGYVIIRDSGGPNVNDKGYWYMGFNYLKKFVYDVLIFSKTPSNVLAANPTVNKDFIQKRWLRRKDILMQTNQLRARVRTPFVTADKLKAALIKQSRHE